MSGDGNSIENQILMVKNYIENNPALTLCNVFSDNGVTGTNFNRPGFENLMQEIRDGKINCIVVKDLSRFGRDYIEAGNFLETIFPRLGIRFISIADNYDSFEPRCQGEGMYIALKNIINTAYAKDISIKTRSAFKAKRDKGEPLVRRASFGYLKSPNDKHQLIIDDDAADIVRMIFKLKLKGFSSSQIARQLNSQNIATPTHYKNKQCKKSQFWTAYGVSRILKNPVYTGSIIMGKISLINGKPCNMNEDDWTIIKNAHEPIISQDDFDTVAEQRNQQRKKHNNSVRVERTKLPEDILKGFIFCKECGKTYGQTGYMLKDKTYRLSYKCNCYRWRGFGTTEKFLQKELFDTIYSVIRLQMDILINQRDRFLKILSSDINEKHRNELNSRAINIQKELDAIPARKLKLYDNFCTGIVEEENYKLFNQTYDAQKVELFKKFKKISDEIKTLKPKYVSNYESISAIDRLDNQKELSREMIVAFVEHIEVSYDKKVEITFRFKDELDSLIELNDEREVCLHG